MSLPDWARHFLVKGFLGLSLCREEMSGGDGGKRKGGCWMLGAGEVFACG